MPAVSLIGKGSVEALPDRLGSPRFTGLLAELSEDYGIVLVEAPAMRDRADAAILSGYCNGIVLVIRSRTVTPTAVSRAIEELGKERLLGIVMTDVEKVFAKGDA